MVENGKLRCVVLNFNLHLILPLAGAIDANITAAAILE